jgi:hypothetical protein
LFVAHLAAWVIKKEPSMFDFLKIYCISVLRNIPKPLICSYCLPEHTFPGQLPNELFRFQSAKRM